MNRIVEDNIEVVLATYEAFGRGDLQAVLDSLTDDVDWATDTVSTAAPWFGVKHGKDGVRSFFEAFGSAMEVNAFEPISLAGNDQGHVHALVRVVATHRQSAQQVSTNEHHFFIVRDGKIGYYRGTEDPAQFEGLFGS